MLGYIAFIIIIVWLVWFSFAFLRLKEHYLTLTQGGSKKSLEEVLSSLVLQQQKSKDDIAKLSARCAKIELDEGYHIQKIGLLRFNPFKDTGGDQSFILALVDAHHTGIVITALYSRSGTRWFTKQVKNGHGAEHQLSEEEKKALQMATELK